MLHSAACRRLILRHGRRSVTHGNASVFITGRRTPSSSSPPLRTSPARRSLSSALPEPTEQHDNANANANANDKDKDKPRSIVDVRKQLWEFYLSTGRGANALFEAIDLDENGTIHPSDVKSFMIEAMRSPSDGSYVDPREIMPYAWNRLERREKLPEGGEYDSREFKKWLVAATKMSADFKNSRMLELHSKDPGRGTRQEGRRAPAQAKAKATGGDQEDAGAAEEEEDENDDDATTTTCYTWNEETMSQSLRRMQYAVRGEVVMRADAIAAEGREVLYTNIGNPHQVGQRPITYYRQIMALCDLPAEMGVDHPKVTELFPRDVVDRAREYRSIIGPSGTGAYTHSQGILGFREHVAEYISTRDGGECPSYPGNIFLTNGASNGIAMVLQGLLANNDDAVMIPIPQYPIYSALIAKLGGRQVGYDLDESLNWAVSREELETKLSKARGDGLDVRAMTMINPGNPSGNVMTHEDVRIIAQFCSDHGIVLLADEVYQANVYAENSAFVSAKKVAADGDLRNLQLISFHSTSKGLIGECGRRGGYMELHGIDPYVQAQLYKLASADLCAGVAGQLMTSLMVRPPSPRDESYALFEKENGAIYDGLKERSQKLVEGLNDIPGISCVPAEGAMYAFPRIEIPSRAFQRAKELGTTPDNLYALSLLEETGICVVPASGFGQAKGRVGFRTTFLHPDTVRAIDLFRNHHEKFVEEYS
mmetsp:Transcript_8273/g.24874  ORF Transcript_8273/g.24874 Transcript_8273/m.24874 type:complete len:710 (-) Transcript_8273:70-2199(-)